MNAAVMNAEGAGTQERRCLVTGRSLARKKMLRFVVDPDGRIVADVAARLPGRGLWLSAERDVLKTACAKGLFGRAARARVEVPTDLVARVRALLERRCLDTLGLARRAGLVTTGFEKVSGMARAGKATAIVAACDASADGRDKVRRLARDVPCVALFDGGQLSRALGRHNVVHAALAVGKLSDRFLDEAARLGTYGRDDAADDGENAGMAGT